MILYVSWVSSPVHFMLTSVRLIQFPNKSNTRFGSDIAKVMGFQSRSRLIK
jgi:hypothetical protein